MQSLTFEAYMKKKPVSARPLAHLKIGRKNLAHLTRLVASGYAWADRGRAFARRRLRACRF